MEAFEAIVCRGFSPLRVIRLTKTVMVRSSLGGLVYDMPESIDKVECGRMMQGESPLPHPSGPLRRLRRTTFYGYDANTPSKP